MGAKKTAKKPDVPAKKSVAKKNAAKKSAAKKSAAKKKTVAKPAKSPKRKRTRNPALTPLMIAAWDGDLSEAKKLLRNGADPNARSTSSEAVHDLLGIEFTTVDSGRTALMLAAYRAQLAIVDLLLDAGALVDAIDEEGKTVLCHAAGSDGEDAEVVEAIVVRLLSKGARPNQEGQFTALQCAAQRGDPRLIALLLEAGADPNARIWTGSTALMTAAERTLACVAPLLAAGADPKLADRRGDTPLHAAAERTTDPAIVRALLDAGADVAQRNEEGKTALHVAAPRYTESATEIVSLLVAAGATIDAVAMRAAAAMNQMATVVLFLDVRRENLELLGAPDEHGQTALHAIAKNGYVDLAAELLARGVTFDARARALALEYERSDFVRLLDGEDLRTEKLQAPHARICIAAQTEARAGRWREALALYLTLPPTVRTRTFEVASPLAYAHQQLGQHAEAIASFERAMKLEPERAHLPKAACYSYCELERWSDMRAAGTRAAELASNDDYVWQQVAIACSKLGDLDRAIEAGQRALRENPKNGYAAYNLGSDLWNAKRPGYVEAFKCAFENAPDLVEHAKTDEVLAGLRESGELGALLTSAS